MNERGGGTLMWWLEVCDEFVHLVMSAPIYEAVGMRSI